MGYPSFKHDLIDPIQNEAYQAELAVLRRIHRGSPLRVLMIASSGENVLSLLTWEHIACIHAIDINPAQIHLCELRRTAITYLTRDEQLLLLGIEPVATTLAGETQRQVLFERVRPHLPEKTRTFWAERRTPEIAFGLQPVGRKSRPLATTGVAGEAALPRYLQRLGQVSLWQFGVEERLRLHIGNVLEWMAPLAAEYGLFDLISLATVADWLSETQFAATVMQARACLQPGGALLARTATHNRMVSSVISKHLSIEDRFHTELSGVEPDPCLHTIAVGFRHEGYSNSKRYSRYSYPEKNCLFIKEEVISNK